MSWPLVTRWTPGLPECGGAGQHRQCDPNTGQIDDQLTRSQVRELLLEAFVPDTTTREADR